MVSESIFILPLLILKNNQTCQQKHQKSPSRTHRGTRILVASNQHLSPHLILLPEHHPEEDFAELLRSHRTKSTPSRDNNPEDPGDDGPGDELLEGQVDSNDSNAGNNLATAISALARNVRTQGDSSQAKVREPDPFDSTDSKHSIFNFS